MRADTQNHVSPSGTQRRTKRDYWEMEREKLLSALMQRIGSKGDNIALRELLALQLPEILNVVLRNHARSLVRKEKPLALQPHRAFELDDPEIRRQFHALRDALAERIVFDLAELKPVLAFGLRLQFDLLVRPRAFLENLLFQHATERERDDVLVILTGFHDPRDYVVRLIETLQNFSSNIITQNAFAALCRRIESEVYGKNPVATLLADIDAHQSYCQSILGLHAPSKVLDNQVILAMLNERNLTALAESLLPEFAKKESWLVGEIESLLREYAPKAGDSAGEKQLGLDIDNFWEEAASEIESQLVQTSLRELRTEQTTEQTSAPQSEAMTTEEATAATEAPRVTEEDGYESAPPTPAKKRPLIRFDEDEPLVVTRAKLEQQPSGPFPALAKLIDDKNRKLFVRNVFKQDEDAYADFIQRVELIQTWKEAKAQLDGELNRRKVNPYTKEAIRLSDFIFSRYFAKR